MDRSRIGSTERAQTAIDFGVAMGVFLLGMAFVLAFIPSMFAPFFGMGVGDALTGDRVAGTLAEDTLADTDATSGVLDPNKVDDFFDEECDAAEQLGIERSRVYVEIGENTCGEEPDESETVSRRIVSIDGDVHTLRVVVW